MPTPHDLKAFRRHAEWAVVTVTALEEGLVDALAAEPAGTQALARRLELDPRATGIVLEVLEEMGLVRAEPDGAWRLTGDARGLLVDSDTPDYQRDAVLFWLQNLRDWTANLPEALREGRPPVAEPRGEEQSEEEAMARFQAAMASKSPDLVASVVDACLERAPSTGTVLDLGGGPGAFTRAFLRRGWKGVLMDRPEVIEHVSGRYGLGRLEGLELVGGDFQETLPDGEFEVVLLANITHIYPPAENAELLRRVAGVVAPGGVLAILDFVRGVVPFASLFGVTMLMNTERGGTYGLREYEAWLEEAGLEEVRCRTVEEERQVVTAVRPA
jgi:SAM-dependent methyltransferase